ncbi:MarR family transcriptional regulator [Pseudonocardia sp. RS11V-5]|uniref:MarR family winged helix-turn-helix transcriptional regulator n=1 Tax=Pseudonocardia terrae TaxID=2905831 RepID=UPI001E2D6C2B|nr:MarR family transcriptional regulator [Pseudonocardia terrae]MCE3554674.1 MarR family transcriptional regulator [Pseudonocardia terrae]
MSSPVPPPAGPPAGPGALAVLLATLGRRVRDEIDTALRAEQLTMRHLAALGHLTRRPGLSYSELGRRTGVTAQSMQSTLRRLEERGAVERRTEPGRGRVAELHVTPDGRRLLSRAEKAVGDVERVMLASLPRPERALLARTLVGMLGRLGEDTP